MQSGVRANLLGNAQPIAGAPGVATNDGVIDLEAGHGGEQSILKQSSHPIALIFHMAFRLASILVYWLSGLVTKNTVLVFVLVILLVAFDFWTVKNVTGRLLVGLRYWNETKADGTSEWIFESREPGRPANPVDSRIFWIVLYATPVVWMVSTFLAIFSSLFWLPITIIALILSSANLIGFMKCDRDAKAKWSGYATNALGNAAGGGGFMGAIFKQGVSNMVSGFTGGGNNNSGGGATR